MIYPEDIKKIIQSNMDCEFIDIQGEDGAHFEATIVSPIFENMSTIKQHQEVYKALNGMMKDQIHALSIKTFTENQWKEFNKGENLE